jgi:hypothetical protein
MPASRFYSRSKDQMLSAKAKQQKQDRETAQLLFHLREFFNTSMDDIIRKSEVKKAASISISRAKMRWIMLSWINFLKISRSAT